MRAGVCLVKDCFSASDMASRAIYAHVLRGTDSSIGGNWDQHRSAGRVKLVTRQAATTMWEGDVCWSRQIEVERSHGIRCI